MKTRSTLLVVIVTYNGEQWIENCLDSVFRSTYAVDVMVIDNASSDQTVSIVRKYEKIVLVENKENTGFGKANNIGFQYAMEHRYEYTFLLNQDTTVHPELFRNIVKAHAEHPDCGILSPIHMNGKNTQFDRLFFHYLLSGSRDYIEASVLNQVSESVYPIHFVNAAFWLISLRCIEKTGGFDPLFFHRGEDNDYINRARHKGFQIGVCPEAIGYHHREDKPQSSTYGEYQALKRIKMLEDLKNPFNKLAPGFRNALRQFSVNCISHLFKLEFIMAIFYWDLIVFTLKSYKKIKASRIEETFELAHLKNNISLSSKRSGNSNNRPLPTLFMHACILEFFRNKIKNELFR